MQESSGSAGRLQRSFYKLLFISLAASIFLSYFIFFIPLNASFIKEQENYFLNEIKVKAGSNEHLIADFVSHAESLSSRTVIRQKLAEYNRGIVGLQELKSFVRDKYADGASAINSLVGAGRYLPDETMVASWGDQAIYARHKETDPGVYLFSQDGRLFALAISRIEEKGVYIGYDACVFAADVLTENKSKIVQSYGIHEAGLVDERGGSNAYSIPLYQERYVLTATPNRQVFQNATLKAVSFVALYSATLFVFISISSYLTFFKFVKKMIADYSKMISTADSLLAEKTLLLKEVHHRIKNSLNTATSLLSLQASTAKESSSAVALQDAQSRIQSMSLLYDKLYRSSDYTELPVKDYLSSLVDEIVANFPNSKIVRVEKNIQDLVLDAKRLQPLGIIINELLTNTMKYAFKGKESGNIALTLTGAGGRVVVSIKDDGNGMPESVSFEDSPGFGLQLVHALVQQIKGKIRIERGNGTEIVLDFMI